jgi:hypothetical protein
MIKPPYYHSGIVVRNHQEAIEHYTNLLEVEFTEPTDTYCVLKIWKRSKLKISRWSLRIPGLGRLIWN